MVEPGEERGPGKPPVPGDRPSRHLAVTSGPLQGRGFDAQEIGGFLQGHDLGNVQRDPSDDQALIGQVITDGVIDDLPLAPARDGDRAFETVSGF